MNKYIFYILIPFLFFSCVKKEDSKHYEPVEFEYSKTRVSGMDYISFYNSTKGAIEVRNLTKDSIEIEYYKTQINVNNRFYGDE